MNSHEVNRYLQQVMMWTVQALDLVFPPRCVSCKHSGHVLCPACLAQILPAPLPRCSHCYAHLDTDGMCSSCRYHPLRMSGLRAFGTYQDVLRSCIHALKYDGCTRLAQPLGHLLARTFYTHRMHADLLIPVPLHYERERQRGYNHASLLAKACSKETGITLREDILLRQRATAAQVGLGPKQRLHNVAGAFSCTSGKQLAGCRILLIDDVCTTGATIEACAAPLFAAGARSIWGLVLARPIGDK